jgi:hypothetical protein
MPTLRADTTHNPEWYTERWEQFLLHSKGGLQWRFPPHRPELAAEWLPAWSARRDELLRRWIAEHPGTRPYAWWVHDRPAGELRRHVAGGGCTVDRQYIPGSVRVEHQRYIICRTPTPGCERVYRADDEARPIWETELEFLRRLNLLTANERKAK